MFVGMSLVCSIVIGFYMFGLTIADGFPRGSLSLGPVRNEMLQSPNPRE